MNVSDFLLTRLTEWGIDKIYGYPGDGINGILGAMNRSDTIRFIQARHEESAAFMACGHAKFTHGVGVCLATSGPGAIHLLNGLYDAKLDHQPVVAIVGQQKGSSLGSSYQQEVNLAHLFGDVATYVETVIDPSQARHVIDRALRIAKAERTVTAIIIPNDVQEEDAVEQPPRKHGYVVSDTGHPTSVVLPTPEELQYAADILNAGERVAMLVGAGAADAWEEVKQTAELLGAGVAKALLGKAVLPDDLPYVTGSIGLLGTQASWQMMEQCDTLLMIGSSFPYSEYLPEPGQARGVQIDLDVKMLSIRYPMESNLLGHSRDTLRALLPYIKPKEDRSWRQQIVEWVSAWHESVEERALLPADPINPQLVIQRLSPRLPDRSIIVADSGTAAFWYARNLRFREGMMGSLSGNLATMCCSVPYAIAAKFAYPSRFAVAISGDGAMHMLCMNELITIAKYYREWEDPRLLVVVLNNRDLSMVTWEQRFLSGEPKFEDSQDIPDVDHAAFATMLGLKGVRIDDPSQIENALEEVMASDRPAVLDVVCDANTPIIPAHVDREMVAKFTKAMMKGDPESASLTRQLLRQLMKGGASFL